MLVDGKHFPPDTGFVFDSEVASIFPDMAVRSIPLYEEVHGLFCAYLTAKYPMPTRENPFRVYDIGTSRGSFLKALCDSYGVDKEVGDGCLDFVAVDSSPSMLAMVVQELPWVTTMCMDATSLPDLQYPAHCISLLYLLQFIKDEADRLTVLRWANRNLAPGGVLLLAQKEYVTSTFSTEFSNLYYKFRRINAYSDEEIAAKTESLKNSMWPMRAEWLEDQCYRAGFVDFAYMTRWLMFSSAVCLKRGDGNG